MISNACLTLFRFPGKSTLVKLVTGALTPTAGRVVRSPRLRYVKKKLLGARSRCRTLRQDSRNKQSHGRRASRLRLSVAAFAQHHVDRLDGARSPLQMLAASIRDARPVHQASPPIEKP